MDITNILSFTLLATLLVVSPGPNGMLVLKTVALSGKRYGFSNILGFVAAFFTHGTFSILGLSALMAQSTSLFFMIKILGAVYLCWLGIKSLLSIYKTSPFSSMLSDPKNMNSIKTAFVEGFITNLLNPKVSLFYLAAFPQFISPENSTLSSYTLVLLHSLINVLWFSVIGFFTYKFINHTKSSLTPYLKALTGFTFIGFGIKMATLKQ